MACSEIDTPDDQHAIPASATPVRKNDASAAAKSGWRAASSAGFQRNRTRLKAFWDACELSKRETPT